MYKVFLQLKSSFALFSALFITFITFVKVKGEGCGQEELMKCAKPLSVLDSGLTNIVSSKADLNKICPDLKGAIRCIHNHARHCMTPNHTRHFKTLFHGTNVVVHDLCKNGSYQEEYLKHVPCMKKVEPENEVCFKRYRKAMENIQANSPSIEAAADINDLVSYQKRKREAADEGIKNVCCSFQEYVECSTHSTKRKCGDEAAQFSRKFLDQMSHQMIQMHCTEYGRRECGLISSSHKIETSFVSLSLALLIVYLTR
ncbi:unnamed protein product [Brassicogethes aeneus]|uniref:Uncharacterized protein n=1 Tax=Brassicogethes aeneus TaxID=1431903 RepID=A0A9P0BN02_BRAAE|nr:unnamed protein product [Brassicogethes aeneus]